MGRRGSRKPEKPRAPVTALLDNFLVEVKKLAPGLTDVRARVSSTDWYPRAAMTSCNHSRSRCEALAGCVSRILELFQRAITSRDCSRSWRASLTVGLPMSPFLLLTSGSLGWGWRTSRGPEWLQKTSRGRKRMWNYPIAAGLAHLGFVGSQRCCPANSAMPFCYVSWRVHDGA